MSAVRFGVDSLPLVPRLPDHAPDAMQDEAPPEIHDSVDVAPDATDAGLAERESVGVCVTTLMVTLCVAVPPGPVHASVKEDVALSAGVTTDPEVERVPLHAPPAEQAVAFVLLQLSVAVDPCGTVVALAVRETAGKLGTTTFTVTLAEPVPPAPAQTSVNVVVDCSPLVTSEPLMPLFPVQPPEAVQLSAPVLLHASVAVPPGANGAELEVIETVGAGAATTLTVALAVAFPPGPLHTRVKVVVFDKVFVLSEPEVPRLPVQPPEAAQLVAFVLLHVSVVAPPTAMLADCAASVTPGTGADGVGDADVGEVPASLPPPHDATSNADRVIANVRRAPAK